MWIYVQKLKWQPPLQRRQREQQPRPPKEKRKRAAEAPAVPRRSSSPLFTAVVVGTVAVASTMVLFVLF